MLPDARTPGRLIAPRDSGMSVFTYRTGIQPSTVCMEVLYYVRGTAYEGSERTVLMALRCAVRSLGGAPWCFTLKDSDPSCPIAAKYRSRGRIISLDKRKM